MKKIRLFEAFAGIGAQHSALKRLGFNVENVGISEWFTDAIIAYDKLHTIEKKVKGDINLNDFTLSTDSHTPWKKTSKMRTSKQLKDAMLRTKNFGSINDIKGSEMPKNIDIFTYSFPCQDLSTGGKNAGLSKGSGTRSGLLWEVERLLLEMKKEGKLPKNLLMENVPPLLSKTHINDYNDWIKSLEKMGYSTSTFTSIGTEFGIPQSRKRVFAVSSLGEVKDYEELIKKSHKDMKTPKDFLRNKFKSETDEVQLNATPSRIKMWDINKRVGKDLFERPFNTITTNMDRQNNAGLLKYSGPKGDTFRMLTPRESSLLMGFNEEEFNALKELKWSWRKYNKLFGNSIIVDVLEAIFKEMFNEN